VGRKIYLFKDEQGAYDWPLCYFEEGQFKDDTLSGFGRSVSCNGQHHMGWLSNGKLNGFGMKLQSNNSSQTGLFRAHEYMKTEVDQQHQDTFESLEIKFEEYFILGMNVAE
jgi:hypothetical protein